MGVPRLTSLLGLGGTNRIRGRRRNDPATIEMRGGLGGNRPTVRATEQVTDRTQDPHKGSSRLRPAPSGDEGEISRPQGAIITSVNPSRARKRSCHLTS